MGACNIDLDLDGKLTEREVRDAIARQRSNDEDENGDRGYTGDWQTIDRITFSGKTFSTYNEAYEHCSEKCPKWEGLAVRYKACDKATLNTKAMEKLVAKKGVAWKKLQDAEKDAEIKAKSGKSEFVKCKECGSRIARKHLRARECPICRQQELLPLAAGAIARIAKLKEKYQELKEKTVALEKELTEKKGTERWLVYGLASC